VCGRCANSPLLFRERGEDEGEGSCGAGLLAANPHPTLSLGKGEAKDAADGYGTLACGGETGPLRVRKQQEQHYNQGMKSAYELAMERLEKASPSLSLTEDQKKQIADVDSVYRAKIAEKELFLKNQINKAQSAGKFDEMEPLEKQLASEIRRLQAECEAKKEKLRTEFAKL
jgi:hypothetical protein